MGECEQRPKLTEAAIYVAMRYGARAHPDILVLQAAEVWHVAPWEIEAAPGAFRWLAALPRYLKAKALAAQHPQDTD